MNKDEATILELPFDDSSWQEIAGQGVRGSQVNRR